MMKKFLIKLFIYALLVSTFTLSLNFFYIAKMDRTDGAAKMKKVPDNIQICNFGSSHGLNGFNYKDLKGCRCFNFALGSQSLLYDYKILTHFRDKLQKGSVVFICLSYFSFFGKPEAEGTDFASKNRRYYRFLPPELIEEYDFVTDINVNYLRALAFDDIFSLFKAVFNLSGSSIPKIMTPEQAAIHGTYRYEFHVKNRIDENGRRMIKQEAFDSLYGMIRICREIGAIPILVTTPYLSEYPDAVMKNDPEFFNDFYGIIDEVTNRAEVKYYDYSRDERFSGSYNLFRDTDHLNSEGAVKFTNILVREVLESENIMPPQQNL